MPRRLYRYQNFTGVHGVPNKIAEKKNEEKPPKGAKVALRCAGAGCKVKRKRFTQKRDLAEPAPVPAEGREAAHRYRPGAPGATAPQTLGRFVRLKMRVLNLAS